MNSGLQRRRNNRVRLEREIRVGSNMALAVDMHLQQHPAKAPHGFYDGILRKLQDGQRKPVRLICSFPSTEGEGPSRFNRWQTISDDDGNCLQAVRRELSGKGVPVTLLRSRNRKGRRSIVFLIRMGEASQVEVRPDTPQHSDPAHSSVQPVRCSAGHENYFEQSCTTGPRAVPPWLWEEIADRLSVSMAVHLTFDYTTLNEPCTRYETSAAIRARLGFLLNIECMEFTSVAGKIHAQFCITQA